MSTKENKGTKAIIGISIYPEELQLHISFSDCLKAFKQTGDIRYLNLATEKLYPPKNQPGDDEVSDEL